MSNNTYYQNDVINNVDRTAAVAQMLSYFDPMFICDITNESYMYRFRPFFPQLPNIILSMDELFRAREAMFPGEVEMFASKRAEICKTVIDTICTQNNLQFNNDALNETDYFSVAMFMYGFFISDFSINMTNFFTTVISKEKKYIYDSLAAQASTDNNEKMMKNSTISLNKKMYSNNKIATIQANMGIVLDNIMCMDFNLDMILHTLNVDKKIIKSILSCIEDKGDFYRGVYGFYVANPNTRPELINSMKMILGSNFIDQDKLENLL